jgi:hypothetical protein
MGRSEWRWAVAVAIGNLVEGVAELKIDIAPEYSIYFSKKIFLARMLPPWNHLLQGWRKDGSTSRAGWQSRSGAITEARAWRGGANS